MKQNPIASFWGNSSFPIAVAHRGGDGAGIEKENSMAAFQAAYDIGYRWFETDVVPTRDGKLLAIHGRGYQRHPNRDLPSRLQIQNMTYDEVIKSISVGGEKPVTLDSLLDAFPDAKFFLDPKTIKSARVLANKLISRPQDIDRVWIGSFIPFNNSRVYRIVLKASGKKVGLALLGPLKAMPIRLARNFHLLKPIAKLYVRWTRAMSVRVSYGWVRNNSDINFIEFAHEIGLVVGVYTPNTKNEISDCLKKGVDVVMSDNIELLKKLIKTM